MITNKEQLRRLGVRLRTLFKIKRSKYDYYREPIVCNIQSFWYTPFELYLLAHIKRAQFIMTCNEYALVDASLETARYFKRSQYQRQRHAEWETKKFTERISTFTEKITKKDTERNEDKNS